MKKLKAILITNIISPYRIPLYNYIYENGNFDFKVVALAEKEKNRRWKLSREKIKFDYKILQGWHLFFISEKREIPLHLNRGVFKVLYQEKPDVIITSGYDCLAYWLGFFYCKIFKKKYILWNGSTLLSAGSVRGIRGLLKKIIIKGANKYIAYGTKAKEYLEYFGANPKNIYTSINTVDVNFFAREAFQYRQTENFLNERQKYPKILLLYVGQLVRRKGVEQILRALNILKDAEIGFMIVGSGPEEKELKEFCKKNRIRNVFFEGFHQQEELPKYYALADIFVLPSFQEVWGVVVNEALASGLYIACSKYAGAAYDLINGKNGFVFNPNDLDKFASYIKRIAKEIDKIRNEYGKISSFAINNLSIGESARNFINAINSLI